MTHLLRRVMLVAEQAPRALTTPAQKGAQGRFQAVMPEELGWDARRALPQVLGRLMNRQPRNQGPPLSQGQQKGSESAAGSFVLSWPFAPRVLAPRASEKKDTIPQL